MTEDENDFACREAFAALDRFDQDVQDQGKKMLEQVEAEDRIAILVVGRPVSPRPGHEPRHSGRVPGAGLPDPEHPFDPEGRSLARALLRGGLKSGRIKSALDINDVWPENYSANSAMKVWAAKFAARHPNVVLLD